MNFDAKETTTIVILIFILVITFFSPNICDKIDTFKDNKANSHEYTFSNENISVW